MKIYKYKDKNGDWVNSVYPKPTEKIKEIANGIIALMILVGMILFLIINI